MRHSLLTTKRHFVLAWDIYVVRTERHQASRLMSHDAIAASVKVAIMTRPKKRVVFQSVCLGWQIFIEVLHLKITLFYSIIWITKTISRIVK